jgi:HEPN domain-containing protein
MADQGDVAEQLLDLAREDLAAAKALNEAEGVSASKSGFNAQQAVEKALKAVLAGRGEDFPFTHDIAVLIELCEDQGFQLPDDLREAEPDSRSSRSRSRSLVALRSAEICLDSRDPPG